IWNWGIFYEKYIRSIQAGGTRLGVGNLDVGRVRNYWWGLDSGLLDFFYAKSKVPPETSRLIELIKTAFISRSFNVFEGPIYDNKGELIVGEGDELLREAILSMDWLVNGITGEIPDKSKYGTISDLSTGKIV
ncbi:MAG: BMP family ABC transporter substrate-binding protein, partial [Acetivibrionales bacterium]